MNKVFNNDNMRRYVHMALSRQIKSMEEQGMSKEEIQAMIDASIKAYSELQLQEALENDYFVLDPGEETYAYGVLIDFTEGKSSPDLKRIGNMELHRTLPVQSQYKGCVWDYVNQEILYYLNPENWNLAVNDEVHGVQKTAEEVASDRNIPSYGTRIETPKFYASSKVLATDGAGHTTMAKVMFSTIKLNASYIEIPRQVTDFRPCAVGDQEFSDGFELLCTTASRGGYCTVKNDGSTCGNSKYPVTNVDRATAREWAHNANTNLMCYEYYKWLFYWAFVIEYATLNSHKPVNNELDENGFHQGGLGGGLTNFVESNGISLQDTTGKDKCRYIGVTNELGNGTGELDVPTDTGLTKTGHPNRYRGFECPFGDIYLVLDGFLGTTVKDSDDNDIAERYFTCANPALFGDELPSTYDDVSAYENNGWRLAFEDGSIANSYARKGYDEGDAMYMSIGNTGDLFAQKWYYDEDGEYNRFFVNHWYPVDGGDKTLLYVGSYAYYGAADDVGLGYFSADADLSGADYHLGFRCFNIIQDDGTVI